MATVAHRLTPDFVTDVFRRGNRFVMGIAVLAALGGFLFGYDTPLRSRAKAMAVATMANWTFNFLISYFFLQLTMVIGKAGTFWMYAGFGVAAVAFFWFFLPETKGRTLEQIERQVRGETEGPEAAAA